MEKQLTEVALGIVSSYRMIWTGGTRTDSGGLCGVLANMTDPWKERPVFGTIRYMNEAGLRRKFRLDGWVDRTLDLYS